MFPEDQLIPISALQHWLYCPRQCALIHVEQAWSENQFTAEGRVMHERAHDGPDESRPGIRITRGMPVRSLEIGLTGQCDVVEFLAGGKVTPVEYKRGRPKAHRADEVQLCAQALCLEEMLQVEVPSGSLYYGKNRRRKEIPFDPMLRELVFETTKLIRECFNKGFTPSAEYLARRCDACSLIDICQPKSLRLKRGAAAWFTAQLQSQITNL
ncbi:CRISPR-associated protein Cas4 [Haloferula chungangensis]|uniref:CRISPR-associated exonuclease Cas4 n=1 Tax=Haloferula chungangensis TaxID=1048331 RepID=A0ABW2LC91_9BACT